MAGLQIWELSYSSLWRKGHWRELRLFFFIHMAKAKSWDIGGREEHRLQMGSRPQPLRQRCCLSQSTLNLLGLNSELEHFTSLSPLWHFKELSPGTRELVQMVALIPSSWYPDDVSSHPTHLCQSMISAHTQLSPLLGKRTWSYDHDMCDLSSAHDCCGLQRSTSLALGIVPSPIVCLLPDKHLRYRS